jgi:acetyltransferase
VDDRVRPAGRRVVVARRRFYRAGKPFDSAAGAFHHARGATSPDALRRPAIRPYPDEYTAAFVLTDGTPVTVRAIRPDDAPLIVAMHATLSERSIRMRYFSLIRRLTAAWLTRLCHLDYDREMALVAAADGPAGPHVLGVARYSVDPATGAAEFAVLVADPHQGRGLGRHLLERLIAVAKDRGVRRLTGLVLRENRPMLHVVQRLGFALTPSDDPAAVEAVLEL